MISMWVNSRCQITRSLRSILTQMNSLNSLLEGAAGDNTKQVAESEQSLTGSSVSRKWNVNRPSPEACELILGLLRAVYNYHVDGESHGSLWNLDNYLIQYENCGEKVKQVLLVHDWLHDRGNEKAMKENDIEDVSVFKGILNAAPCIQFDKEGILLAVSTSENGIKILANADGVRLLHSIEDQAVDTSRVAPTTITKGPIISTFGASYSTAGISTSY
ncbi:hypothetical protein CMV_014598 [Castanea mollissima]|uniref:Uncharacterized protein n=1 Tax=Castanea mollissima TaxID=60419 RepID=A0A8J4R6H7_9ROSI|nr:hypothetical protein CMV_014598 [Castanea mollissima]